MKKEEYQNIRGKVPQHQEQKRDEFHHLKGRKKKQYKGIVIPVEKV